MKPRPLSGERAALARAAGVCFPDQDCWEEALGRAARLWGESCEGWPLDVDHVLLLARRMEANRQLAVSNRAGEVRGLLLVHPEFIDEESPRLRTATTVCRLMETLALPDPTTAIEAFARLPLATGLQEVRQHLSHSRMMVLCLSDTLAMAGFQVLRGRRDDSAQAVLTKLRQVMAADEIDVALSPAVRALALRAQRLIPSRLGVGVAQLSVRSQQPEARLPHSDGLIAEGVGQDLQEVLGAWPRIQQAMQQAMANGDNGVGLRFTWRVTRARP